MPATYVGDDEAYFPDYGLVQPGDVVPFDVEPDDTRFKADTRPAKKSEED